MFPLDQIRLDGLSEEAVQREYYCNFEANKHKKVEDGYIFSKSLLKAEEEGRITRVEHDSRHLVETYWDIGLRDYTCIWFVQIIEGRVHVIDFYANRDKLIDHYLYKLKEKTYRYSKIVFPHDQNRQSIVGTSSWVAANDIAQKLNLPQITLGMMVRREELMHIATSLILSKNFYIDEVSCQKGLQGLHEYDFSKRKTHSSSTFATDASDSFCYMANGIKNSYFAPLPNFHNLPQEKLAIYVSS